MVTVKQLIDHLQQLEHDAVVLVNTMPGAGSVVGDAGIRTCSAGVAVRAPLSGIYVLDLQV